MEVMPYGSGAGKKAEVASMFNAISGRYDLLNRLLSFRIDTLWRRRAVALLAPHHPKTILDVATGTADFALALQRLRPEQIIGVDISAGMLEVGRQKIKRRGSESLVKLHLGDSEQLNFPDASFDAVTVAFGVRNFENLEVGLREMARVLKPEGRAVILEFSKPKSFPFKQLYWLYFKAVLPVVGALISRDKRAYTYLPESVAAFPEGKEFENILATCGFARVGSHRLTGGIASIYVGVKA